MNVLLIGLRCSGKSTIGRLLAQRLGEEFVDLDDLTPGVLGAADVRDAWNRFGQEAFRNAETVALSKALTVDGRVIALGGGTPTAPMAADLIRDEQGQARASVIYLAATADTLRNRLARADNAERPSLTGASPLVEVESVLAQRDSLYRDLADAVVPVDHRSPTEVSDEIARLLG